MIHTIKNGVLSFEISSKGAEPWRITTGDGTDYLWNGQPPYWDFRAHHIFPWIARLHEKKYRFQGKEYQLDIHGFLKDSEMKVDKKGKDFISFRLDHSEETFSQFPFAFQFFVHYRLEDNRIHIQFEVRNLDSKTMYFAVGGHPGFMVPLEKGLDFSDYYLEFSESSDPKRAINKNGLFTGNYSDYPLRESKYLDLTHSLFDSDAIMLKDMAKSVMLKSDKGRRSVKVEYPDFKYLGLWHNNGTEAPLLCIEPWTTLQGLDGVIEDFEENQDLVSLAAGKNYRNNWTITIE